MRSDNDRVCLGMAVATFALMLAAMCAWVLR